MFPVCSFCGERDVIAWFEGPDFTVWVPAADQVSADEATLACSVCLHLVETEDRDGLCELAVARAARKPHGGGENARISVRSHLDDEFWAKRSRG